MKIDTLSTSFGKNAKNLLRGVSDPGFSGAVSCLESFYYAFNQKDLMCLVEVWDRADLVQLNNPIGGIIRGIDSITKVYEMIFKGKADVWVEFTHITYYATEEMVVFAGEEIGAFEDKNGKMPIRIRTTRNFYYDRDKLRWYQFHHHGSIDNAGLLNEYQNAIKGAKNDS